MATRVLIVDDHLAIREGIRSLLAPELDFAVVGEAVDGMDGVQKALALKPDLIVLDNSMPGKTGLEVARELKPLLPDTEIVFLTLDPGIKDLALAVGAVAHISKDSPPQHMLEVLRNAAQLQERRKPRPTAITDTERRLGLALVASRLVSEVELDKLITSRHPGESLSAAVIRSHLVPDRQLAQVFSDVSGRPLVTLTPRAQETGRGRRLPRLGAPSLDSSRAATANTIRPSS